MQNMLLQQPLQQPQYIQQQQQLQPQQQQQQQIPERKYDFYVIIQGIIDQEQLIEVNWKVYSQETKDFIHSEQSFIHKKTHSISKDTLQNLQIDPQVYNQQKISFKDLMKKLSTYINENIIQKDKQFLFVTCEEKFFVEYLPKEAETNWITLEPYYFCFVDLRLEFFEFYLVQESQKDMIIVDNEVQGSNSRISNITTIEKSVFKNVNNLAKYFGLLELKSGTRCEKNVDLITKLLFILIKTRYKFQKFVGNPNLALKLPQQPQQQQLSTEDLKTIPPQTKTSTDPLQQNSQQLQQQQINQQTNITPQFTQQQQLDLLAQQQLQRRASISKERHDRYSRKSSRDSRSYSRSRSRSPRLRRKSKDRHKKSRKYSSDQEEDSVFDEKKIRFYGICLVKNLPSNANRDDIHYFFKNYKVLEKGIFMDYEKYSAYAVFPSKSESLIARNNLNNQYILKKPVYVDNLSNDQISDFKENLLDKKYSSISKKPEEKKTSSKFSYAPTSIPQTDSSINNMSSKMQDISQKYDSKRDESKYHKYDKKYDSKQDSKYDNKYDNKYDKYDSNSSKYDKYYESSRQGSKYDNKYDKGGSSSYGSSRQRYSRDDYKDSKKYSSSGGGGSSQYSSNNNYKSKYKKSYDY